MRIIKYIKEEYRGWLIGLLLAPFVIAFGKFFTELNSTIEFSNLTTVILNILCLTFCVSFMIFIIISGEFEFHEMTGCTEYEPEDLDKFKRNLKKTLTVYSIALLIFGSCFSVNNFGIWENWKYLENDLFTDIPISFYWIDDLYI